MKKALTYEIITALLILLFVYSGFSKLFDFPTFKRAMHNQPFAFWLADLLSWVIPPLEILIASFLVLSRTRLAGLVAFLSLMILFTGYIAAILLGSFKTVPCGCGELIQSLSWGQHLIFNLVFIGLALYDIRLFKNMS